MSKTSIVVARMSLKESPLNLSTATAVAIFQPHVSLGGTVGAWWPPFTRGVTPISLQKNLERLIKQVKSDSDKINNFGERASVNAVKPDSLSVSDEEDNG